MSFFSHAFRNCKNIEYIPLVLSSFFGGATPLVYITPVHTLSHTFSRPLTLSRMPSYLHTHSFTSTHSLTRLLTHTHSLPLPGEKAFYIASHLKQHMEVHLGLTPFECTICGVSNLCLSHFFYLILIRKLLFSLLGFNFHKCEAAQENPIKVARRQAEIYMF